MKIDTVVKKNHQYLVEQIHKHLKDTMLSPYPIELRLYVDESGTISLKRAAGFFKSIWNGEYYSLCSTGGFIQNPWEYIGDVFTCLSEDDNLDVLEEIPGDKVTRATVEAFIEEQHPEWIERWLEEHHDNHYYDEIDAADELLDRFLDDVRDFEAVDEDRPNA